MHLALQILTVRERKDMMNKHLACSTRAQGTADQPQHRCNDVQENRQLAAYLERTLSVKSRLSSQKILNMLKARLLVMSELKSTFSVLSIFIADEPLRIVFLRLQVMAHSVSSRDCWNMGADSLSFVCLEYLKFGERHLRQAT